MLEFIRGYLNLEIKLFAKKNKLDKVGFKNNFRGTKEHNRVLIEIKEAVKKILNVAEKIGDKFEAINIENLFNDLEKIDINDNYHLALAFIEATQSHHS